MKDHSAFWVFYFISHPAVPDLTGVIFTSYTNFTSHNKALAVKDGDGDGDSPQREMIKRSHKGHIKNNTGTQPVCLLAIAVQ